MAQKDKSASLDAQRAFALELEQMLSEEPAPDPGDADAIHVQLVSMYADNLREPATSVPHIEVLLGRDEVAAESFVAADQLLGHRSVAPQVAEMVSEAYRRTGEVASEAGALARELRLAKSPRVEHIRRRLAQLRAGELGDPEGAIELIEAMLSKHPGDDEARKLYIETSIALERQALAIKMLTRATRACKDLEGRARAGFDLGTLCLEEGETGPARKAWVDVVKTDVKCPATLRAAQRLIAIDSDEDTGILRPALAVVASLAPEAGARLEAGTKLITLYKDDDVGAAVGWRTLIDSPRGEEALDKLHALYTSSGDAQGLGDVLQERAVRSKDPAEARELAIQSAKARANDSQNPEAAIAGWTWVVEQYGPSTEVHRQLMPLLEKAARWEELAKVLEAVITSVESHEQASLLAKLGRTRYLHLDDSVGALAVLEKALILDEGHAVARSVVEKIMAVAEHRSAAASVLEPVYRASNNGAGLARVLEIRADAAVDPSGRLQALAAGLAVADSNEDAVAALDIVRRALTESCEHSLGDLTAWVDHHLRWVGLVDEPKAHATTLTEVLGDRDVDSEPLVSLASAAAAALIEDDNYDDAQAICARMIVSNPSSVEIHGRVDALLGDSEAVETRLGRYKSGLQATEDLKVRRPLRAIIADIYVESLDDLSGALATWHAALSDDPQDFASQKAVARVYEHRREWPQLIEHLDAAIDVLGAEQRQDMLFRKGQALAKHDQRDTALEVLASLLDEPNLPDAIIEKLALLANEEDEGGLYERALKRQSSSTDEGMRVRALERLGDFQYEQLGDVQAARTSWMPAADHYAGDANKEEHGRQLYERVLEATPDDREAATRLIELYAASEDWVKIPGVYGVLLRTGPTEEATANLLLGLEERALGAWAVDEYVSMLDEAVWHQTASSPMGRRLMEAKARALTSDPGRQMEASQTFRALIETHAGDEDIEHYVSFYESKSDVAERHEDRRWLFDWRARTCDDAGPVFTAWAVVEEKAGDLHAAIGVYERMVRLQPESTEAWEALIRLREEVGDVEGSLESLIALRELCEGDVRVAVDIRVAELLLSLGRCLESVEAIAHLISAHPVVPAAQEIAHRALADADAGERAADLVEQAAAGASEPEVKSTLLSMLLEGRPLDDDPSTEFVERRAAWFEQLTRLRLVGDADGAMALISRGMLEMPGATDLWRAAEDFAREVERPDPVIDAYRRVLLEQVDDAETAEAIGQRMVDFHGEWFVDASLLVDALGRVLELQPSARWAFDRVKLELSASGEWDEFFRIFDRAIEMTQDAALEAELLDEASVAAKDLAGLPDRAIGYLERIHQIRPEDAPVVAALKRLYEQRGRPRALIELLSEGLDRSEGLALSELRRRIATLWLELGDVPRAGSIVGRMLADSDSPADTADLYEQMLGVARPDSVDADTAEADRVARSAAIDQLTAHYTESGQPNQVIRMAKKQLELMKHPKRQAKIIRRIVQLRLELAKGAPDKFAHVVAVVSGDAGGVPELERVAAEAVLKLAMAEWKSSKQSVTDDAVAAAWLEIQVLAGLHRSAGEPESCAKLLERSAGLPFPRERQRELLSEAARTFWEGAENAELALPILRNLFEEDSGDSIAQSLVSLFDKLLEDSGSGRERAALWEGQARWHNNGGEPHLARELWARAAQLWEAENETDHGIEAHRQGAALGSDAALEALATRYVTAEQWTAACEVLEWIVSLASQESKGKNSLRLADAYIRAGSEDQARARLAVVREADADIEEVQETLAQLYRKATLWPELAAILSQQGYRARLPERQLMLLRESADVYLYRCENPHAALPLLRASLEISPDTFALRLLFGSTLDATGQRDEAITVLQSQVESYGHRYPKERGVVHRELASVLLAAERGSDALEQLVLAAKIDPTGVEILYDLGRLALEQDQLEQAEKTYRALLLALHHGVDGSVAAPTRAEVYLDLAEISKRQGDAALAKERVESAFDSSLESVEQIRSFEEALRQRELPVLLARAIERRLKSTVILSRAAEVLEELSSVYAELLPEDKGLRAVIEAGAKTLSADLDSEERDVATTRSLASVYRSLGELSQAAVMYERVFDADPTQLSVLQALLGVYQTLGQNKKLVKMVEATVPLLESAEERQNLRLGLAETLFGDESQDPDTATLLRGVLEEQPENAVANSLLVRLLERQGKDEELIEVLQSQLARASADKAEFLTTGERLGRAWERKEQPEEAAPLYEEMLLRTPGEIDALRVLASRLETVGSDQLVVCLERMIPLESGSQARDVGQRVLALKDKAGDAQGARQTLEALHVNDPANVGFRKRLVSEFEEAADYRGVARVLSRALEATPKSQPLLLQLVQASQKGGDNNAALDILSLALENAPTNASLLRARAEVLEALDRVPDAVRDLTAAHSGGAKCANELVRLLEIVVTRSSGPEVDASTLQLVELLLASERADDGRQHLATLMSRTPLHPGGLQKIAEIAMASADWVGAMAAYKKLLPLVEGDIVAITLAYAACCNNAGNPAEALDSLAAAVELEPENKELREQLETLYEEAGRFRELADLLYLQIAEEKDNAAQVALFVRATRILLKDPTQLQKATDTVSAARAATPGKLDMELLWVEILTSASRYSDALAALEALAEGQRGKRSKSMATIHLAMANTHFAVDDIFEAFDALKKAFNIDPLSAEIALQLGLTALDLDEVRTADRALRAVTTMKARPKNGTGGGATTQARATAYYHLGRAARDKGDRQRARMMLTKCVQEDPQRSEAQALLEQLTA